VVQQPVRDARFLGDVADARSMKALPREHADGGTNEISPAIGRPASIIARVTALENVTVADLTRHLPGPFASRELLRLGARVVKIEPPGGDPLKHTAPGWYAALNDGKEIVDWDAKRDPAPAVLATADVVLEGFRPGVFERLNAATAPHAIVCSITGFGADGPRAQQAGHDLNYLGYAGVLADTAPAMPPVQLADLAAGGQAAVIEILAALLEGGPKRIVVSMTAGAHRFVAHRLAGDPSPRLLTGGAACYRIYETADGRHLTVAALEPKFWRRLCELLGRPDLEDKAFAAERPELAALFKTRPLRDWLDLLEGEETCVGPVLTLTEAGSAQL
jgi:crotonobetainyl-CoA:carnitine CoA-transferase CaiB-like acyl-CoA transferase